MCSWTDGSSPRAALELVDVVNRKGFARYEN